MPLSSAVNLAFLRHYFENVAIGSPPSGFDIIAYTTTPALDGTGGVEAAYSGYSRVAYANSDGNWDVSTLGSVASPPIIYQVANTTIITLPTPGANGSDLTGLGLLLTGTSTLVAWGALTPSRPVVSGVELTIPVGQCRFRIQPSA